MRSTFFFAARSCLTGASFRRTWAQSQGLRRSSTDSRQWSTPLAKQLFEAISATGPIPLASFMRMCLTSDLGGYYTSTQDGRDQFGQKGDFITSPEISQIFGELIGIWFVAEWMAQGRKSSGVELMEVGPGRGTLMDDILRTIQNFKSMAASLEAVYLVEASPALREAQRRLLCGDTPMTETSIGFQSTSKYANVPVIWTENLRFVPSDPLTTPFIVAHEFFDALPIHVFQSVTLPTSDFELPISEQDHIPKSPRSSPKGPQWREMVVSPLPAEPIHGNLETPRPHRLPSPSPEFQLTLSRSSTPHSLYLPEISPRYQALKAKPGSLIEISPESHAYVQEISKRIGGSLTDPKSTSLGAAIILDYGPSDTIPINSLRGVRNHLRVSPLSSPGVVDISADVDFTALAEAALSASPGVEVHGPVEQSTFLLGMGIRERAEILTRAPNADYEKRTRIETGWRRLVDRSSNGMGKIYKAMAIVPESGGERRPIGFGGNAAKL